MTGQRWEAQVPWPASASVRILDLAQELAPGIPHHPNHPPYSFTLTKQHGEVMYPDGVSASAEMITTGGHVGTHVDGLAHVSKGGRVFGDQEVIGAQSYVGGMEVCSVHEMAPMLARGRFVDAPTYVGRDLEPGDAVDDGLLQAWSEDHGRPEPGDVVLIRTGWSRHWHDVGSYLGVTTGVPGIDLSGARWLTDHGVRATGSDTIAYEVMPSGALEVHVHLLVEHGVPIMEAMNLDPLADEQVDDAFFFVASPLSVRGGTGSPIRPLAIIEMDT